MWNIYKPSSYFIIREVTRKVARFYSCGNFNNPSQANRKTFILLANTEMTILQFSPFHLPLHFLWWIDNLA